MRRGVPKRREWAHCGKRRIMLDNLWTGLPGNVWLAAVASINLNGCALAGESGMCTTTAVCSWYDVPCEYRSRMEECVATKGRAMGLGFQHAERLRERQEAAGNGLRS